jgi:HAD superfamily phosphatase (TIGR01668 family)
MSFSLIPDYSFRSVCCVTPDFLKERGVRVLLLDLDNTIAPYGTVVPPEEIAAWAENMKDNGIMLFIVSNNRGSGRVGSLASAFGVDYIMKAGKPGSGGVRRALERLGRKPEETALMGDQIFTDVLAANRAGALSIVVEPIRIRNPLLNLRYWAEAPFRALCKNRMTRQE